MIEGFNGALIERTKPFDLLTNRGLNTSNEQNSDITVK